MFNSQQNETRDSQRLTWREYQTTLKAHSSKWRPASIGWRTLAVFLSLVLIAYGVIGGFGGAACHHNPLVDSIDTPAVSGISGERPKRLVKSEIQRILDNQAFINLKQKTIDVYDKNKKLEVETSLEISLQQYLGQKLDLVNSRYIGIVAMDPSTGKVLAMVGFDKTDSTNNPCTEGSFPAASIFKIVTAAAAIEKKNYGAESPLTYNGRKYTLYKSQLKEKKNKWTRRTTLRESFAQSVNPVFGKIGALYLGKQVIETYAAAFGFNRSIDFEIRVTPSSMTTTDDPYQLAEIASGFNRKTRISPLHGAVMASAIVNQGRLIEPTIVNRITDPDGRIIYTGMPKTISQAITPESTKIMNRLMAETIISGTSRKAFKGHRRDKVLSQLNIGGKTGSISNDRYDARYDWFVGFAEEKNGAQKLVLSIVVAHEEYIGIRAAQYARMAIKQYFKKYTAGIDKKRTQG